MRGLRQAICSGLDSVGAAEAFRLRKAIAEIYDEPLKEREPIENIIFPQKSLNTAYAQYFIGNSYLVPLTGGSLPIHNVTFATVENKFSFA